MKVEKPPLYKAVIEVEIEYYHDQFKTLRTADAVCEDMADYVDEELGSIMDAFDNIESIVVRQSEVVPFHKN